MPRPPTYTVVLRGPGSSGTIEISGIEALGPEEAEEFALESLDIDTIEEDDVGPDEAGG